MSPIVSIIIPTYNREKLLNETLESIKKQTYHHWECIIVDDGSTDDTEQIVSEFSKSHPSIQYFKRPDHLPKGPNSCRNYGFCKSKGSIINWFDSDDLYLPTAFQNIIDAYSENVDVVVGKLEIIDYNNKRIIKESKIQSTQIIEDYFTGKTAFYVCGPFWNRKFIEKQSLLFDETIRNLDDWDFNLRMILQNPKVIYLNEVIIQYRFHSDSLSQEIHKFNFAEIQSEISAREKMLMILKEYSCVNRSLLINFHAKRCQFFLREALLQKHPKKYYLLFKTLNLQILNCHFLNATKTIFGFLVYTVFGKGYKFIKR
jgi:glycosyltransferase involved in cell wall biosynthesis